jgi:hypothetical protein
MPLHRTVTALACAMASIVQAQGLRIVEIRIDQPGPDLDEFFELAGPPGASLEGISYVVLGDDDVDLERGCGIVEERVDLSSLRLGADGLLCVAEPLARCTVTERRSLNFENNDNVTHLLVRGCTARVGDDLDRDDDGQLDVQAWDEVLDAVAIDEGRSVQCAGDEHVYAAQSVLPQGAFSAGHIRRCGDVWQACDFEWPGSGTPGMPNDCEAAAGANARLTRR